MKIFYKQFYIFFSTMYSLTILILQFSRPPQQILVSNTSLIFASYYFVIFCYKDYQYGYIRFKCISLRLNIYQRNMSRWKVSALESWVQVPFYDDIKMFSMWWVQKVFSNYFHFRRILFFFQDFFLTKNNNFFYFKIFESNWPF